jgi:DNA recombination protein RmuC
MDPTYIVPPAICIAAIVILAGAVWIWRLQSSVGVLRDEKVQNDLRLAVEGEKVARIPDLELLLQEKTKALDNLREAKSSTDKELAATTQTLSLTNQRLEVTERELELLSEKLETAGREKAVSEGKLADKTARLEETLGILNGLRDELRLNVEALEHSRNELANLQSQYAKLQEALDQVTKAAEEKLSFALGAKEEMANQFRVLGQAIMAQQGESLKKQNIEQLDGLITPLREKLGDFQQQLTATQTENSKERAALGEQIRAVLEASSRMSSETNNLTQSLKGKSQTQGAWGEMILKTILEKSGLREGEEYVFQESRTDDNGFQLRPDVVVNLPSGEKVVIDSKVSLSAFYAYVNTETDEERNTQLALHIGSISKHIDTLSDKEYQHLFSSQLNFVIMFVPIEGALAVALQKQPELTVLAAKKNVAIATPTTLMLALKTIANLWQVERRNRNAEEIAERAGKLYDKFVGFIADLEEIGGRLIQAQTSYNEAMDKLAKGKGNLVRQAEMVRELGAKTGKNIAPELLEGDELEPVIVQQIVDAQSVDAAS